MQHYLQQDVHINIMLWHYLPDIPFNSGHQEQHLFVVNGLGRDDPVYWLPQFTGCRHRLRDGGQSTVMRVTLGRYLNIMYTVQTATRRTRSQRLVGDGHVCAGSVIDCTILSKVNSQDLTFIWCWVEGGGDRRICVPVQFKCQVDKKKKRERKVWGRGRRAIFSSFWSKKRLKAGVQLESSIVKKKEAF